jgi:hypothetical protein
MLINGNSSMISGSYKYNFSFSGLACGLHYINLNTIKPPKFTGMIQKPEKWFASDGLKALLKLNTVLLNGKQKNLVPFVIRTKMKNNKNLGGLYHDRRN